MTIVIATRDDLKVGDTYNIDGIERTILSIKVNDNITELEVNEEGADDAQTAKAISKQQALANMTVTTSNGNKFYANAEARVDMLSAITTSQITKQTEAKWKLVSGWKEVTVEELSEAMMLALQAKGKIVS